MSIFARDPEHGEASSCLRSALDLQRAYLAAYEKPCEPIAYEMLRTLDDVFCRDLIQPWKEVEESERRARSISGWGVNHALRRVVPTGRVGGPFRDFPSHSAIQGQADDFLFNCGALALSERFEGWLREGLLVGEVRAERKLDGIANILILRTGASSCYDEEIGRAGLRWAGNLIWREDRPAELALEERHTQIAPELERCVRLIDGWQITYSYPPHIDDYFMNWAKLYLRRIFSQDMLGPDDMLGGRPFSRYLDVLTALSARSQKHIAFAAILLGRHPSVHIRNLLTTYCSRRLFIESLADFMGGDRSEVESILSCFTLAGDNLAVHTQGADTTWAPIVQASTDTLILPTYGIDINPFLFLLTDLRYRHEADWFRVANNRERRWIGELGGLFPQPRWRTHGRNLRLQDAGKVLTDIDFAAYEPGTNQLGLFQLKWQQPVGIDNRARRSAGKNLLEEGNRWVSSVLSWLSQHGVIELMKRLRIECLSSPSVYLFVLGRYHVHLGGYDGRDDRATWCDWAHLRRVLLEGPRELSIEHLAVHLRTDVERARAAKGSESMMFPVGNIAVVLNPSSVPEKPEPA